MLHRLVVQDLIPVVAPIGGGEHGETHNITADTAAGAIAAAVDAGRFLLLPDVAAVLDQDRPLLPELTVAEPPALNAAGTISGAIGRASCRHRGRESVYIAVFGVSLKQN